MELVVEPAGVADGFPVVVPSPQGRLSGLAVGADRPLTLRRRLCEGR